MAQLSIAQRVKLYEDDTASNAPQEVLLDYQSFIDAEVTTYKREDLLVAPASSSAILASGAYTYALILTDQTITIRFNGDAGNTVVLSPSAAARKDGILLKTGSVTSLTVVNPSATASANISVFLGA